ncbi:Poly [ADP-ribose] polymerase [Aphelenchoides bicaudatus]|nr:Poly [ADP-ribose] polymerase [Aphelenchoides bicaudatus]
MANGRWRLPNGKHFEIQRFFSATAFRCSTFKIEKMSQKSPAEHQAIVDFLNEIGGDDSNYNAIYNSLSLPSKRTFNRVDKYIQNTHSPKHDQYTMKLVKLFEIDHPRDTRYRPVDGERCMLLFHGTEKQYVYSILNEGLRYTLASEFGLFGQGIYTTDCASKAANFTCSNPMKYDGTADQGIIWPEKKYGYMFLCQVATGLCSTYNGKPKSKDTDYLLEDNQGRRYNSVMGIGKY